MPPQERAHRFMPGLDTDPSSSKERKQEDILGCQADFLSSFILELNVTAVSLYMVSLTFCFPAGVSVSEERA